jgi:hypothetical protein
MTRTYFQRFERPRGYAIEVEYSFDAGSEATYSPTRGADGGDPAIATVVGVSPAADWYDRLVESTRDAWVKWPARLAIAVVDWWYRPGDEELEKICTWLDEHHEHEPDDFEDDRP